MTSIGSSSAFSLYRAYPFHSDRSELILHVEADTPELNVIRGHFVSDPIASVIGGFVTAKLIPLFPILEFTEIRPAQLEPDGERLTDPIIHAGDRLI